MVLIYSYINIIYMWNSKSKIYSAKYVNTTILQFQEFHYYTSFYKIKHSEIVILSEQHHTLKHNIRNMYKKKTFWALIGWKHILYAV